LTHRTGQQALDATEWQSVLLCKLAARERTLCSDTVVHLDQLAFNGPKLCEGRWLKGPNLRRCWSASLAAPQSYLLDLLLATIRRIEGIRRRGIE
jgi:hypothetical protein